MSKVFVIPDIHLKPPILDQASKLIEEGDYDLIVMLGDIVDDWDKERDLDLYLATFDAVYGFISKWPNTILCYGNHDVSYIFGKTESGYSTYAKGIVIEGMNKLISMLPENSVGYVHRIDNTIFSHAGVTERFVKRCFGGHGHLEIDELLSRINRLPKDEIWRSDSPLWARPQRAYDALRLYPMDMFQVVGHSPVETATLEGKLLTLDTFSTYWNGEPIGDNRFVWVDTVKEEYHVIE